MIIINLSIYYRKWYKVLTIKINYFKKNEYYIVFDSFLNKDINYTTLVVILLISDLVTKEYKMIGEKLSKTTIGQVFFL